MQVFEIERGANDQSIDIFVKDSTVTTGAGKTGIVATAGIECWYRLGFNQAAAELTPLSVIAVNAAHTEGGWIQTDASNQPGIYRFDIPDAWLVGTYGDDVTVYFYKATGMSHTPVKIKLVDPVSDVNQIAIPDSLTAVVQYYAGVGNRGSKSLTLSLGELQNVAIDFGRVGPLGGRLASATVTQLTEPTGGLLGMGTPGVDHMKAKVSLTPDLVGTYTMEVVATYVDGGGQTAATITIIVVA